jgi:hypothetical protein
VKAEGEPALAELDALHAEPPASILSARDREEVLPLPGSLP